MEDVITLRQNSICDSTILKNLPYDIKDSLKEKFAKEITRYIINNVEIEQRYIIETFRDEIEYSMRVNIISDEKLHYYKTLEKDYKNLINKLGKSK